MSLANMFSPGYYGRRQQIQQEDMGELQQAGGALNLANLLEAAKKKQAYEADLQALGPDASEAQRLQVAYKYAGPTEQLKYGQASQDRQTQMQIAKEAKAAALGQMKLTAEQTHEMRMARLKTDDERVQETARHNKQQELIASELADIKRNAGQAVSPTEIIDPQDQTRMLKIDARTYKGGTIGSPGVLGVAGKEPTAAKREEQVGQGREGVSSLITTLRDQYQQLQGAGGIVDPNKGMMSNLGAAASASPVGQMVGRAVGTQNQSIRNQIAQQRPLLLQAIKQATGMSAKQMDSNAEMKLYLAAATDPTLDIKANLAALDKLDELYGLSGTKPKANAPSVPAGIQEGQTATGPNGQKIIFKGGQWQPAP